MKNEKLNQRQATLIGTTAIVLLAIAMFPVLIIVLIVAAVGMTANRHRK